MASEPQHQESYGAGFAALYDLFYEAKDYAQEAAYLDRSIRASWERPEPPRTILDVAAGTGEHALALERLGYEVTAVDRSEAMLERARTKASDLRSDVRFVEQDMTQLSLPNERFDIAVCLFDSIGYAVTNDRIRQTLESIRSHLATGALLFLEYWHAPAMLGRSSPVRVKRFESGAGPVVRISETEVDPVDHLAEVRFTAFIPNGTSSYRMIEETHTNRFFSVAEMDEQIRDAGFVPLGSSSGFSEEPVSDDSFHVIARARCP